jgi:hypothetical protein
VGLDVSAARKRIQFPEYALPGATRLPRGGPDRLRFARWYGDAIADGKTDAEARAVARGCLFLLYAYATSCDARLLISLGPCAGGVSVERLGEEDD